MASSIGSFETREAFLPVVGGAWVWPTDDAPSWLFSESMCCSLLMHLVTLVFKTTGELYHLLVGGVYTLYTCMSVVILEILLICIWVNSLH